LYSLLWLDLDSNIKYIKIILFYYREHCTNCCQVDEEKSIKVYAKARLEVCTCKFGAYPQIQGKWSNLILNWYSLS